MVSSASAHSAASSDSLLIISRYPYNTVSGVRNSWLTLAKKLHRRTFSNWCIWLTSRVYYQQLAFRHRALHTELNMVFVIQLQR